MTWNWMGHECLWQLLTTVSAAGRACTSDIRDHVTHALPPPQGLA